MSDFAVGHLVKVVTKRIGNNSMMHGGKKLETRTEEAQPDVRKWTGVRDTKESFVDLFLRNTLKCLNALNIAPIDFP